MWNWIQSFFPRWGNMIKYLNKKDGGLVEICCCYLR